LIELLINNGSQIFQPVVNGSIIWETERKNQPGKLTFSVSDSPDFQEGNPISLTVDGVKLFYGFVFKKDRDKEKNISVIAYDQLRYFKNRDTYIYSNKTADELIRMIAADFNLKVGTLENTTFKIATRVEDNQELFDIVQNSLDLTLENNKTMYVLYDDFGSLTLKNVELMKVNLMIDEEAAENYKYSSTIDGQTFNKIKLSFENEKTGKRDIYIAQDSSNINLWGVLQYFETIDDKVNGKAKAEALLELYNRKTRNLTITNAFGDVRIRSGCSVPVNLDLGDVVVQNFMVIEKVKHQFEKDEHTMDLSLRGGGFSA
jgi:hypothetical protein